MKKKGKELTPQEQSVVESATAVLLLGLDLASAPNKWAMLRTAATSLGGIAGGVGVAKSLYNEVGTITTNPNKLVEAKTTKNILSSPEFWRVLSSRSSEIGYYLVSYRGQIEPRLASLTTLSESKPSELTTENKIELMRAIVGPSAFPAILRVLADSQNSITDLISTSRSSEGAGYKAGSFGDSLDKLGLDPKLLYDLLPIISSTIDKLSTNQQVVEEMLESLAEPLKNVLEKKEVKLNDEQREKLFSGLGKILFDKDNGAIIPLINALEKDPSIVIDVISKLRLKDTLKAQGLDLDNPVHKTLITAVVSNIIVEVAKNPEAKQNLENIVTIMSLSSIDDEARKLLGAEQLGNLLVKNSNLSVIIPALLKEAAVPLIEILAANPSVKEGVKKLGINLDDPAQKDAFIPTIAITADIVTNLGFDERDKNLYAQIANYVIQPSPEKLLGIIEDTAAILFNNPTIFKNIIDLLSKDNIEALKPALNPIVRNNTFAMSILNDSEIVSNFGKSFISEESLKTAATVVSSMTANGVLDKLVRGATAELDNQDIGTIYDGAISVLKSINTSAFIEENKRAITSLVQQAAVNLDTNTKEMVTVFTPILVDTAKRILSPENIQEIEKFKDGILKLIDPSVSTGDKIKIGLDIIKKELDLVNSADLQSAVKNNKDKLFKVVDSMLEKANMPEDKQNNVKKYMGLILNVVERPTMLKDISQALKNSKTAQILEESAIEKFKGNKFKYAIKIARAVISSPELLRVGYNLRQVKKESRPLAPQDIQGQITARGAHARKVLEESKASQDANVNIPNSENTSKSKNTLVGKLKTKLFGDIGGRST